LERSGGHGGQMLAIDAGEDPWMSAVLIMAGIINGENNRSMLGEHLLEEFSNWFSVLLASAVDDLTNEHGDTLVIGLMGAGGVNSGNNASFISYVTSMGGLVMSESQAKAAIGNASKGAQIEIYGYSRGGNAAVDIANWAGQRNVKIKNLTTFDPHSLTGNFTLHYDNVEVATNYYQKNPTTGGFGILPLGTNPYQGRAVSSNYIVVGGQDFTGNTNVNHINIVSYVTGF
ncbi:MAG: hypothetical protein Q8L60_02135, partial [Gammaproteobacteria bacterium]|nr:hypothetical protein [Gammaproteobacteria bacterium]MDP2347676.1 hypothetical protein [Gammaproteobacteria bacterium]